MIIWVNAQLSPAIASWIAKEFAIEAKALRDLGLRDADDIEIYEAAQKAGEIVILSKDIDFVKLLEIQGAPPYLIWLTCGNTSNQKLKEILGLRLLEIMDLFQSGESLVEVK